MSTMLFRDLTANGTVSGEARSNTMVIKLGGATAPNLTTDYWFVD